MDDHHQYYHQLQYRGDDFVPATNTTTTISRIINNTTTIAASRSVGDNGISSNFMQDLIILDSKPSKATLPPISPLQSSTSAITPINEQATKFFVSQLCQQHESTTESIPQQFQIILQNQSSDHIQHPQIIQLPQHVIQHQIIHYHHQKPQQSYHQDHHLFSNQEVNTSVIIQPTQPQLPPPTQQQLPIVTELDYTDEQPPIVLAKKRTSSNTINITAAKDNQPIKCSLCDVVLKNLKGLKMHQQIHDGVKKFHCDECPKSFLRSNQLKSHKKVHTGERPYTCTICQKSFAQSSNYRAHMKIHTGSHPFCCKFCNKRYGSAEDLATHNIVHVGINRYRCTICGKEYQRSDNLKNHKLSHTGDKPFPCRICGKRFSHSSILSVHMRTHTGEKPYECKTCGKKFAQWTNYNRHLSLHTGEKPHSCEVCKKSFARVAALKTHEKVHENGRTLECKLCDKRFLHDVTYEQHMKAHSGTCDECGLNIDGGLREYRRHQRVQHQKRVKCDICRKRFKSYSAILEHMNAEHMSEKMYKCNECDEFFGAILLENHCRLKHPYYEYQECPYCKCDFPNSAILIEHLKSHIGEKPLQCSQCGKLFKRYGHYKSHQCVRHALKRETEAKQAARKKLEAARTSKENQPEHPPNDTKNNIKKEPQGEFAVISREKILNKNILSSKTVTNKTTLKEEPLSESLTNQNDVTNEPYDDCDDFDLFGASIWQQQSLDHDDDDNEEDNIHKESVFCETLSPKLVTQQKNKIFKSKQKKIYKKIKETNKAAENKIPEIEEVPQTCSVCNRQFRNQRSLKIHLETHGEKRFQCERCAMSFVRSSQLKSHTYTHTGERPYQCEICSKQFSQTSVLRIHMRTHTGAKPYQCDLCEKRFSQSANYHRHRALHSGEKPHQCIACGKRFARLAALKKHENVHTNVLPAINKSSRKQKLTRPNNNHEQSTALTATPTKTIQNFKKPKLKKRKSQLIIDLINEPLVLPPPDKLSPLGFIGDKPYPCKICLKTFSQSSILTVHMRIHTGERPYKCSSCDKSFTQWTNYNRHLSVHTGARPFACEHCDKKFARLQTLKIHLNTHFKDLDGGGGGGGGGGVDDEGDNKQLSVPIVLPLNWVK